MSIPQSIAVLSLALILAAPQSPAADLTSLGYLDVTAMAADPTGARDSTAAIQAAVNAARDRGLVLFFPAGTYTVSDTIDCLYGDRKTTACRLVGSTAEAGRRAVIRLAPNSPGFGDPDTPKVVVHLRRSNEGNADHYEQSVMSIDVRVGPGNEGAVGVRNQGAENTHIEDMTIDLSESGYAGLWGPPGSGGSTHKVHVIGGRIGINTYDARAVGGIDHRHPLNSQPTPVLTGITLENQSEYAVKVDTRGPMVMVGCRIATRRRRPVVILNEKWAGDCLSGQINLIDSSIEYATPSDRNTVFEMDGGGRSFLMENCWVRNARRIYSTDMPAEPSGWCHVRRLGYAHGELPHGLSENPYVDGERIPGDVHYDRTGDVPPPADLQSRHTWGDTFPSFESPGAVNVKTEFGAAGDGETDDTAALQAAIDAAEIVFLPRGRYQISDSLRLKRNTKLIGVHSSLTQIITRDSLTQRFGSGTPEPAVRVPMIDTPDVPDGDVVIAGINVASSWPLAQHDPTQIESYPMRWRCNALFRDCHVHPNKQTNYHPAKVIDLYYDDTEYEDNGPYPAQMKYDVLLHRWPLILVTGHGGGRFYNFFLHGDHYEEPEGRLIRIEGTTAPLSIYHFHCQHNQGDYFLEAVGAERVAVYGSKSEMTFAIARFQDCGHVRYFGHGGIGAPAPGNPRGIDWFFRFDNVANFVFGGFAPQLYPEDGHFRSHQAPYHCWWHGAHGQNHPLVETRPADTKVEVGRREAPILYVRGEPGG
jgi:hypothetical protein